MKLMISLITLDPGHFHAALIQKEMYPEVSPRVHVYAPLGKDLVDHLQRVSRFNLRDEHPTAWELEVHAGPDFLERMVHERAGNVVVLSGRNRGKIDRILAAIGAGLHVLADKPWIIETADLPKLQAALDAAEAQGLVAYDIMTERYEVTSVLQRELVQDQEIFGTPLAGSIEEPGVFLESVHHLSKTVAGVTLQRPVWFFDIHQQGEGLTDVGTHLVDLVPWTLFPNQAIDYHTEVQVLAGRRWPTTLSAADLQRITGEPATQVLDYYCNTAISYVLRGLHVKLNVLWNFEAPPGGGDTHLAIYRGTRSRVEIRQGPEEGYRPELFVVGKTERAVRQRLELLQTRFPGLDIEQKGDQSKITIPDRYRVGHEAHFAQVAGQFFEYLNNPADLPPWEKANQLAKYYVTTRGVEMAM
jgi:predicted dehydrogenase